MRHSMSKMEQIKIKFNSISIESDNLNHICRSSKMSLICVMLPSLPTISHNFKNCEHTKICLLSRYNVSERVERESGDERGNKKEWIMLEKREKLNWMRNFRIKSILSLSIFISWRRRHFPIKDVTYNVIEWWMFQRYKK